MRQMMRTRFATTLIGIFAIPRSSRGGVLALG